MIISTKRGEEVIYTQVLDDSKTLNATVAHLMNLPPGRDLIHTLSNNGHTMTFPSANVPLEPLVRKVNGIPSKQASRVAKPATT